MLYWYKDKDGIQRQGSRAGSSRNSSKVTEMVHNDDLKEGLLEGDVMVTQRGTASGSEDITPENATTANSSSTNALSIDRMEAGMNAGMPTGRNSTDLSPVSAHQAKLLAHQANAKLIEGSHMAGNNGDLEKSNSNNPATGSGDLNKDRIEGARSAYADRDIEASKAAHEKYLRDKMAAKANGGRRPSDGGASQSDGGSKDHHHQKHNEPAFLDGGEFAKPVVFGGLDGISTSFALLAGALGADLPMGSFIAIAFAQVFAGAFAMGFGEYVSAQAEQDIAKREYDREDWEVDHFPEGEILEMVEVYQEKAGMTEEDAITVARTLSKYRKFWVDHMLVHEIGIMPPEDDDTMAFKSSIVMFFSFLIFGFVPVVAYLLVAKLELVAQEDLLHPGHATASGVTSSGAEAAAEQNLLGNKDIGFGIVIAVTLMTLFGLGAFRSKLTEQSVFFGGMSMTGQGVVAFGLSYLVGGWANWYFNAGGPSIGGG